MGLEFRTVIRKQQRDKHRYFLVFHYLTFKTEERKDFGMQQVKFPSSDNIESSTFFDVGEMPKDKNRTIR